MSGQPEEREKRERCSHGETGDPAVAGGGGVRLYAYRGF